MFKKIKDYIWTVWQYSKRIWIYPVSKIDPGSHFDYDQYWKEKRGDGKYMGRIGGWQIKRAALASKLITELGGGDLNDIGSGAGEVSQYIKDHAPIKIVTAYDSSNYALMYAKERGFKTKFFDVNKEELYEQIEQADFTIMFEILEHIPGSEALLKKAIDTSSKGVMFSFPNTGFIIHRLRLLFGKFPMQWQRHPGEHLRFWTKTDLMWWLHAQGYKNYTAYYYVGVPVLKRLWPNMFAAGMFVFIPSNFLSKIEG